MRINQFQVKPLFTKEGAPSSNVPPLQRLRRLSLACMLWEDTFYVDGESSATLIEHVCQKVKAKDILELAVECHQKGLLRHVPLYLVVQAIKKRDDEADVKNAIFNICTRPDQMTELLSIYWKDGKKPITAKMKKGLAKAFHRFDEYQLAKYNRDTPVKLRDVLFLSHPKPLNKEQDALWKRLINNELNTPDTWEVNLSAGNDKKQSFEKLLTEGKLGKLAIIRNFRNMHESGVPKDLVERELLKNGRPLLPFQFLMAAKCCPHWEDLADKSMIQSIENKPKLSGVTILLLDVSGSMDYAMSGKSKTLRTDAACGIAILLREICEKLEIFSFSDSLQYVPLRRGMALRDAILSSQPHQGTYLGAAIQFIQNNKKKDVHIDRIIVVTDEQTHDVVPKVDADHCYILNVGSEENGIKNNGQWMTISGFSESCIDYIIESEKEESRT